MASSSPLTKASCTECGCSVAGRFCSNCGAELATQHHGILRQAIYNVTHYPATLVRMLVNPVRTTLELAQDPSYRGHVSFLTISVGFSVLLSVASMSYVSEELSKQIAAVPELGENATFKWLVNFVSAHQSQIITTVFYVHIAMLLMANYMVLKRFRPTNTITLAKYFKLFCLASGLYLAVSGIVQAISLYVFGVDSVALQKTAVSQTPGEAFRHALSSISTYLSLLLLVGILFYHVRVQTRYWGLSTARVIASLPVVLIVYMVMYFSIVFIFGAIGAIALIWWA